MLSEREKANEIGGGHGMEETVWKTLSVGLFATGFPFPDGRRVLAA